MRWRSGLMALAVVAAGGATTTGCSTTVDGTGRQPTTCRAVFFGVPGSGQGLHNPAPPARPDGVSVADARRYGTTVALLKTELAQLAGRNLAQASAVDYPAIPVDRYLGLGGLSPDLDVSEAAGVRLLVARIRAADRGSCRGRPVLLAGYSQGAEVVVRAVSALRPAERRPVAVALFGNPSYQPGIAGDYPGHTRAAGVRPTFRHTAYTLPPDVRTRTIDVCAPGDPVCGVDPSVRTFFGQVAWVLDHVKIHETAYAFGTAGYPEAAAKFLWAHRTG